jgi:hypothetical protein
MAQKPGTPTPSIKGRTGPAAQSAKPPARERSILRTVLIAAMVLLVGFAAAWVYLQRLDKLKKQTAYSKPIEVAAAVRNQTMRLTFAVRVTGADAEWINRNGTAIEAVMKEAMTTVQPQALTKPDVMRQFEEHVRSAANAKLDTDKVKEVVITDYLYTTLD